MYEMPIMIKATAVDERARTGSCGNRVIISIIVILIWQMTINAMVIGGHARIVHRKLSLKVRILQNEVMEHTR